MMKSLQRWSTALIELAAIVLIALVAKGAVAEPFYVPSPSMEPTLLIGDALVASKYPYGYGMASVPMPITLGTTQRIFGALPERGDVVVFRWPGDISQTWVKRAVVCRASAYSCAAGSSSSTDNRRRCAPMERDRRKATTAPR